MTDLGISPPPPKKEQCSHLENDQQLEMIYIYSKCYISLCNVIPPNIICHIVFISKHSIFGQICIVIFSGRKNKTYKLQGTHQ